MTNNTLPVDRDWKALAEGIRAGQEPAVEQFYKLFNGGFRFFIRRQLGPQDLEDNVHDCVMSVICAVRETDLRDPDRFVCFVRTIVQRYIGKRIADKVSARSKCEIDSIAPPRSNDPGPERILLDKERMRIAALALQNLNPADVDVLRRFYLMEQTQEQICRELNLSPGSFRNLKHRAKNRFAVEWHVQACRGRHQNCVPYAASQLAAGRAA